MKKYEVMFQGGEGDYGKAVNFMLSQIDDTRLYAEVELPEGDVPEDYGYDELKAEILEQAKAEGIPTDQLAFWYDAD